MYQYPFIGRLVSLNRLRSPVSINCLLIPSCFNFAMASLASSLLHVEDNLRIDVSPLHIQLAFFANRFKQKFASIPLTLRCRHKQCDQINLCLNTGLLFLPLNQNVRRNLFHMLFQIEQQWDDWNDIRHIDSISNSFSFTLMPFGCCRCPFFLFVNVPVLSKA